MEQSQAMEGMFSSQEGAATGDWEQQQNERARFKQPRIRDLFPANFIAERDRFFQQDTKYDPHFCYKMIVSPEVLAVHRQHRQLALKILTNNKHYGHKLPMLTEQEVLSTIGSYLEGLGLQDYVQVQFESNCLSRTSVAFFPSKAILRLRTPVEYNRVSLEGVLNHEVGTHILRRLNHQNNCVRKPSQKGKLIEEGLAAINQMLPEEIPFLFKAALRYVAAIYASESSFSQVYRQLFRFMDDQKDCWRECVRVKRGLGNTEEKGGYYKDQSYLVGAVDILRNRTKIDFRKIYYGKLSAEETLHLTEGVLPPFIDSEAKHAAYLKKLDKIALCNFID